jgi:glutamyl-tRNA synthetase
MSSDIRPLLEAARDALADTAEFTPGAIQAALDPVVERAGVKPRALFQPLRVAVTGTTISPGIYETVALLGRDEALARIDAALARLRAPAD